MTIQKATMEQFELIQHIYAFAREQMQKTGNPTQWGSTYPSPDIIRNDIEKGQGYLVMNEGTPCGVFAFIIGDDPTYRVIEDGGWLNDNPYGVIHRVASDGTTKGVLAAALDYCEGKVTNIRIDTHHDNKIMQHLLEKRSYIKCGVIYTDDGTPRIAYQRSGGKGKGARLLTGEDSLKIRTAKADDLDAIAAVEAECFPAAEAATKEEFEERLRFYADHFLLMFDGNKLVAFIDGFTTNESDLTDEMYARADLHDEDGKWQMIFGVNTIPSYRRRGLAGELIRHFIEDARRQGRLGVVLTCKDALVDYYAGFGFVNEGRSNKSSHGGVSWNQMRLEF